MSQTGVRRDDVAWFVRDVNAAQREEVVIDCEINCGDKEKRSSMRKTPDSQLMHRNPNQQRRDNATK